MHFPENQFKAWFFFHQRSSEADAEAKWLRDASDSSFDRVVEEGDLAPDVKQPLRVRGSTSWSTTTSVTGSHQLTAPSTNQAALNRSTTPSALSDNFFTQGGGAAFHASSSSRLDTSRLASQISPMLEFLDLEDDFESQPFKEFKSPSVPGMDRWLASQQQVPDTDQPLGCWEAQGRLLRLRSSKSARCLHQRSFRPRHSWRGVTLWQNFCVPSRRTLATRR